MQKRPIILRSLLIVGTSYVVCDASRTQAYGESVDVYTHKYSVHVYTHTYRDMAVSSVV